MKEYYERLAGCELQPEEVDLSRIRLPLRWTIELYAIFFPIYDETTKELIQAKDLSEFNVATENYDTIGELETGTILGHMLTNPRVMVQEHINMIVDHMFDGIARRLEVSDPKVALRILTYFSYDFHNEFFLKRNPREFLKHQIPFNYQHVSCLQTPHSMKGVKKLKIQWTCVRKKMKPHH